MDRMHVLTAATIIAGSAGVGVADEKHFDVWLRIVEETFVTGAISEDEEPLDPYHRVFGAEFGEDPEEPFAGDEPGLQLFDGSLEGGAGLAFAFTGSVTRWNGVEYEVTAETVTFELGPQSATSGPGRVEGFEFTADGAGGFHNHFEITINGAPGPQDPADGVYLIPIAMRGAGKGPAESDTFWFVMNLNMPEEMHEAAMEWVEENLAGDDPCHRDLDGSGAVDFGDLVEVLSGWGPCEQPPGFECPGDVNRDGAADFDDALEVLTEWGPCP